MHLRRPANGNSAITGRNCFGLLGFGSADVGSSSEEELPMMLYGDGLSTFTQILLGRECQNFARINCDWKRAFHNDENDYSLR